VKLYADQLHSFEEKLVTGAVLAKFTPDETATSAQSLSPPNTPNRQHSPITSIITRKKEFLLTKQGSIQRKTAGKEPQTLRIFTPQRRKSRVHETEQK
jgi:hypothetical protein